MGPWSSFIASKLPIVLGLRRKRGPVIESVVFTAADTGYFHANGTDSDWFSVSGDSMQILKSSAADNETFHIEGSSTAYYKITARDT
jgi:hypothetical protein